MKQEIKQMQKLLGGSIPFSRSEDSGIPVYFQLARVIQDQIERGRFRAGTLLPSERKISALNKLSIATVRKAFEELARKGFIHRIQGKGTFVTSSSERLSKLLFYPFVINFTDNPLPTSFKTLGLKKIKGKKKIRDHLEVKKGQDLLELKRLIFSRGKPLVYCISYFPQKIFKGMENYQPTDFEREPLYMFLEKEFNIPTVSHDELFGVSQAKKHIAAQLQVNEGHPLLGIEKLIFTHQRKPFEYRESYCVVDDFKVRKRILSYKQ